MRQVPQNSFIALLGICFLMAGSALGQYEISRYTIDGGGGTSTGGPYTMTGTIGQADADWASGDSYELLGGFWPAGPLCIIDFDDFAKLATQWLAGGSGLDGDLDGDNDIDLADVAVFSDLWLCYCPADWPLK